MTFSRVGKDQSGFPHHLFEISERIFHLRWSRRGSTRLVGPCVGGWHSASSVCPSL